MRLQRLHIQNFRGLQNIDIDGLGSLAVLAGPNAIGKTSVLEALRFAKCHLAPSYPNEAQETMNALGMTIPGTTLIDLGSIAGDPTQSVRIRADFRLTDAELTRVFNDVSQIALQRLRTSLASSSVDNSILAQYVSTPEGRQRLQALTQLVETELVSVRAKETISIQLDVSRDGFARGQEAISHDVLWYLSQAMPSYMHGLFSYFPADRAMPPGEANIQVGANDAQAQRASHLGQPATKYNRLKNFIVSQKLLGTEAATQLHQDFQLIFRELLENKELSEIRVTPRGKVSVQIVDKRTGRKYDIDQLSSGEKGVVLTFLLMRITVAPGGIILLDEPELHLNAAVCRRLLDFIATRVCSERDLQVVLCTHSPEILASAYASDSTTLLHLRKPTDVTPIRRGDREEVNEALRLLGARPVDMLYSRALLFVEGSDDAELLMTGFGDLVRDLKISKLGGRGEVEKHIRDLQRAEHDGKLDVDQCFLFDLDNRLTTISSTPRVRVAQWDRYCLENFLLDGESVYDAAKAKGGTPESIGTLKARIRELAEQTLRDQVVRRVCEGLPPSRMTLKLSQTDSTDPVATAELLGAQYEAIRSAVMTMDPMEWKRQFRERLTLGLSELGASIDDVWEAQCDGKRVISALFQELNLRCSLLAFKREVMAFSVTHRTSRWTSARDQLARLLGVSVDEGTAAEHAIAADGASRRS